MLLDIHPEPEFPVLEVWTGHRRINLGRLDTSKNVAKVHAARAVLASVVSAGYFASEQSTTFEFLFHFDGVDSWLTYMAERWTEAVIDPDVCARASRLLQPIGGELIIREQLHAARLRVRAIG